MFEKPVQPLFNNGQGSGSGQHVVNPKKKKNKEQKNDEIDLMEIYKYSVLDELAMVISKELKNHSEELKKKIKFDGKF